MQNKPPVGLIDKGWPRGVSLFLKCPRTEGLSTQAKVAKSFSQIVPLATSVESNSHSRLPEPPRGGSYAHPGSSPQLGWASPGMPWSPHPLRMALR